jgi:raffinose/stachyose/melibiose transport system permease protein
VPVELEDAAAIDGCSRLGFFFRVLLPLSKPALMTVSILALVTSWNMFLLPLLVLNNTNEWTLPLGVANYSTEYTQDTARILAYTALSMIPALAFFLVAERRIVGGLSGAVKG